LKILAVEKEVEGVTEDQYKPYLKNEAKRVWELVQSGTIREIYFTEDDHCAIIILECKNAEEAKSILNTLPLVNKKLISFEIKPLVPYDGFARLFE
jgi:muconolactone delta-isomerase